MKIFVAARKGSVRVRTYVSRDDKVSESTEVLGHHPTVIAEISLSGREQELFTSTIHTDSVGWKSQGTVAYGLGITFEQSADLIEEAKSLLAKRVASGGDTALWYIDDYPRFAGSIEEADATVRRARSKRAVDSSVGGYDVAIMRRVVGVRAVDAQEVERLLASSELSREELVNLLSEGPVLDVKIESTKISMSRRGSWKEISRLVRQGFGVSRAELEDAEDVEEPDGYPEVQDRQSSDDSFIEEAVRSLVFGAASDEARQTAATFLQELSHFSPHCEYGPVWEKIYEALLVRGEEGPLATLSEARDLVSTKTFVYPPPRSTAGVVYHFLEDLP